MDGEGCGGGRGDEYFALVEEDGESGGVVEEETVEMIGFFSEMCGSVEG